jgi:DnaJ-class molecular chaperone
VQKAYRVNLHPDLQPAAQKAEAEKRFKKAEAAFDQIRRLRGF